MKFGERLRELRKQQGISQRELASLVGVDYTYVSKIETSDTPPPSLATIHRIALALAADEDELVELANKVSIAAYRARIAELEAENARLRQEVEELSKPVEDLDISFPPKSRRRVTVQVTNRGKAKPSLEEVERSER